MKDLLGIVAFGALASTMCCVGIEADRSRVGAALKDRSLAGRAIVINFIVAPLLTVALLKLFAPAPMVAVGFLLIAVCPGGAYGPPLAAIAKGDSGLAAGLMIILSLMSPLIAPVLLTLFLPLVATAQPLTIDLSDIVFTLLAAQLLPLLAGIFMQGNVPSISRRVLKPCKICVAALNLTFVALAFSEQLETFREIRGIGFIGMGILFGASLVAGWLGGRSKDERTAVAWTTALRNNSVGIVVATSSFPGTAAVSAVVIYGLLSVLGGLAVASAWSRLSTSPRA